MEKYGIFDDHAMDSHKLYLEQATNHEILTGEEEFSLGVAIQDGLVAKEYLSEFGNEITDEELREKYATQEKEGVEAQDILYSHNLRLVVNVAKKYRSEDIEQLDIIQMGNEGLIRAVEKFDPYKGFKFSTYAVWWIRQAIQRGILESKLIKLSQDDSRNLGYISMAERELEQLGEEFSDENIAELSGLEEAKVKRMRVVNNFPISLEHEVLRNDEGDSATYRDILEGDMATAEIDDLELKDTIKSIFSRSGLTEKELEVMELRTELVQMPEKAGKNRRVGPRSHKDIANFLGVRLEIVRRLRISAEKKIRERMTIDEHIERIRYLSERRGPTAE